MRGFVIVVMLAFFLGSPAAQAEDEAPLEVRLEPGEKGSRLAPRYSPKGFRVPLAASERPVPEGSGALEGRLPLGPESTRDEGFLVVVARSDEDRPFDRLWIDTDGDGSLEDEITRSANPRVTRGTVYTSYDAVLQVNHGSFVEPVAEAYPIGLWVAVDAEDSTPAFIRFSRRGFLVGSVTIRDAAYQVVLSDADHDAVYGAGDWWALLSASEESTNDIAGSRKVGDFAWAGREAWRLELEGTRGRQGRLVPVDPGLTPEEDARARDPYWDDKHAQRAEQPVVFRRDVDAALADVRARTVPCFLDFETVWCGPCKSMDRWVWNQEAVVAAVGDVVCIKIDGDERKDLKEAHGVGVFPTGILIDSNGEEIVRFQGYQTGEKLAAFFARVRTVSGEDE